MPLESPWDHNAECRYCDEQAAHAADCSWLVKLEAQLPATEEELRKANATILAQAGNIGGLRREVDEQRLDAERERVARRVVDEALRQAIEQASDLTAKLQFLVNWADARESLAEHSFTFPDGDTWLSTLKGDPR
jgi:NAD(P)-dependent dehydrogenase (short-subunit alcohol dehydrogenase family)